MEKPARKRRIITIYVCLILTCNNAYSEPEVTILRPSCIAPIKPMETAPNTDFVKFDYDSNNYNQCLAAFIQQQEEKIEQHKKAISNLYDAMRYAHEDWLVFSAYQLKQAGK